MSRHVTAIGRRISQASCSSSPCSLGVQLNVCVRECSKALFKTTGVMQDDEATEDTVRPRGNSQQEQPSSQANAVSKRSSYCPSQQGNALE